MVERRIDREWFAKQIARAGFKSQSAFANAAELTPPKLSNALAGKRRLQVNEIHAMAQTLNVNVWDLMSALGEDVQLNKSFSRNIYAVVGDGSVVISDMDFEGEFGQEDRLVPYSGYDGLHLLVTSYRLSPRYRYGDVLGANFLPFDEPDPGDFGDPEIAEFVGMEVIARLKTGQTYLGSLFAGRDPHHWTVTLPDPTATPLVDVELQWVAAIDVIVPAAVTHVLRHSDSVAIIVK